MRTEPASSRCVAVTCMRDDGSYVLEWIAHHVPVGFDHFVFFTHDCSDGTPELLDALSDTGLVTHVPFRHSQKVAAQWQALKLARRHPIINGSDWLLFFDCDEFLWLSEAGSNLATLLDTFEARSGPFDALAVPWRLFGSGSAKSRESGLTPERFTRAAPSDLHFPLAHLFKSIIRPDRFEKLGVHRPKRPLGSQPTRWLGPDAKPLPVSFSKQANRISLYGTPRQEDLIGLNHYSLRSLEEFLVKRQRGLPNHMNREIGLDYWVERNWNSVTEARILPMLDATRRVYSDLLSLPPVRVAHERCVSAYADRAGALQNDLQSARLAWQVGLLSENRPPDAKDALTYIARQAAGAERNRSKR